MPKLKNKWLAFTALVLGTMKIQRVTYSDVGSWLGCHRTTASMKVHNPGQLTMDEILKIQLKLKIPDSMIKDAIPFY